MADRIHIGLDNQAFNGRLRRPVYWMRPLHTIDVTIGPRPSSRFYNSYNSIAPSIKISDPSKITRVSRPVGIVPCSSPIAEPTPPHIKRQHHHILVLPNVSFIWRSFRKYTKLQIALLGTAGLVFILGLFVCFQTMQTNHNAAAQVLALSNQAAKLPAAANNQQVVVPSTIEPSANSLLDYTVAPDLPRYLIIPKLAVDARVLKVGITKTGALGTPGNVYDTAWYTGSAKPGKTGATLIDGHVSSWTTKGVFYGIKTLVTGDTIQIVRGDGLVINYQVVKTQVYDANNVDMQSAVTPITTGKSGLNLITCTGDVKPGTSLFDKRVVVFAQQV